MKKIRLSLALVLIALLVAGIGSAALSVISLDRTVEAGVVLSDVDSNVAVQISALGNYDEIGLFNEAASGEVSFDLKAVLSTAGDSGWNTDAHYVIGSAANGVFQVTNNSDVSVVVSLASVTGGLTLVDSTGDNNGTTVVAGASQTFYYDIATAGVNKATVVGGTLQIRNA